MAIEEHITHKNCRKIEATINFCINYNYKDRTNIITPVNLL